MSPYWLRAKPTFVALILSCLTFVFLLAPFESPVIDPEYGLLEDVATSSRFAIATFLSANPDENQDDPENTNYYYAATRVLTYQLLHADNTRIRNPLIDFLVLTTKDVPQGQRARLEADGATVVAVEDIPLSWWIKTGVTRWRDQFTKLRLLEMTQYSRVCFLDADTFLTGPLDGVFREPGIEHALPTNLTLTSAIKSDEAPLPASFVFAARSDNDFVGQREHPVPPPSTDTFSAGFWVAAPSQPLFQLLLSVMQHYHRFDPHTMEQSLLNYVFRRDGAMPWTELNWQWSATWPSEADLAAGVRSLHEKLGMKGPPEVLRQMWFKAKAEMHEFYKGRGIEK
ncbi:glycosyltransferase family 8 protein [Phyllosticta capitalensis]|uniref:Glycosyltransferase family 8 protein n=1 Tax=Phyllosticta capitalensis TaxID=121624 RepID=A0ABR1YWA2_9PEZI